jgi:hypothetical protein
MTHAGAPTVSHTPRGRTLPRARAWAPHLPLLAVIAAAVVVYLPALRSPFVGDDYLLLVASRDMSFAHFLNSAANPWAAAGALRLSDDYWRPLSFLAFRGMYAVFGGAPLAYHLFNLGVHLAAVALVYALALRLMRNRAGALAAAAVMALHPAGFESIAWISSINSAGLPLALGAWLAFAHAIEQPPGERARGLALACGLAVAALAFRETADVIIAAMLLWYVLVPKRQHLRERATLLPLLPFAVLLALHTLRVGVAHQPGHGGQSSLALDRDAITTGWFYVKQALVPAQSLGRPAAALQQALAVVLVAVPFVALARRQWLVAAMGLAFLVSIIPYAAFGLGFGPRYFYFPSALLALLAGAVVTALAPLVADVRWRGAAFAVGACALAVVALGTMAVGYRRVGRWVASTPDQQQAWVDQLRAQYPTLPPDGGLFAVNLPFIMALLDGYIIGPTVTYYYPGADHPIYIIDEEHIAYAESIKKPDDRIFIYKAR